ncbi:hypothetical protein VTL71DRAFT_11189 [Oculimacula yallundae]|uniref:Uncharacterized protein n=1 Tax=Oculimacula yallundae TaxID=86028 RepID=A0ABR4CV99_9HELO
MASSTATKREGPPRLVEDVNDPLFLHLSAIRPDGDGDDLSDMELCLVSRLLKEERHAYATKYYTPKEGLFYSKFAPNRPDLSKNSRIENISDTDLAAAGIPRNRLPQFASGGAPSELTDGWTDFFTIVHIPQLDSDEFSQYVRSLSPGQQARLSAQSDLGEMFMKFPRAAPTFQKFVEVLTGAAMRIRYFSEFHRQYDSTRYTIGSPTTIYIMYKSKLSGDLVDLFIDPETYDDSWKQARKIFREYRSDEYVLGFGWGIGAR